MSYQQVFVENPEEEALKWSDYSEFKTWIHDKWNREKKVKQSLSIIFDKDKRCFSCNDFSGEKDNTCFIKTGTPKKKIPIHKPPISIDITEDFNKLPELSPDHQYLVLKGIDPTGLGLKQVIKYNKKWIAVPVFSKDNEVISLQTIGEEQGEKKYLLKDYPISNNCPHFPIGEVKGEFVFLCEGLATGYAINQIVESKVYTTFGREHLDSIARWLLQKYKEKIIVMCVDFDVSKAGKDTTHIPKLKNQRLIILKPESVGDFDDHKKSMREIEKLKYPDIANCVRRITTPLTEVTYVDHNNLILRGYCGLMCGPKLSMKSTGMLSYLRKNKLKTLYFSAYEQTDDQVRGVDLVMNNIEDEGERVSYSYNNEETQYIDWLEMEAPNFWEKIDRIISVKKPDLIFEDPPLDDSTMNTFEGLRKWIGIRAEIAKKHNISWVFTRNFAKYDYKELLNKVAGFNLWTNVPRFTIAVLPIKEGHKLRQPIEERDPVTKKLTITKAPKKSLVQVIANNADQLPTKSLIFTLEKRLLYSPDPEIKKPINKAFCTITEIERVKDPQTWVLPPDLKQQEIFQTQLWQILHYIYEQKDKGGVKSATLVAKICSKDFTNQSESTAYRIIRSLKKQGYISGGGQDKKAPYNLTKAGIDYVDKCDDEI